MPSVTINFTPGFRLTDGSDLNALVEQINAALAGAANPSSVATGALTATGAVVLSNASVIMGNLPTADPHVAGRLYTAAGVVTVSAG